MMLASAGVLQCRLSSSSSSRCRRGSSSTALQQRRHRRPLSIAAAAMDAAMPQERPAWRSAVNYTAVALLLCNLHRSTWAVLMPQLSLSPSAAGGINAAHLAAYLVGQLPSGRLADQLGGVRVLVASLAAWSAATAATGLPCAAAAGGGAVAALTAARAAMGLASAAAMPCVTALSAQLVPQASRGSAVSFIYAAFALGGVLGLVLVPALASAVGLPGAFYAAGAAGLAWAALAPVLGGGAAAAPAAGRRQPRRPAQPRGQPSWRHLAALVYTHAMMGFSFFILQAWIPSYLASVAGGQGALALGGLSAIPWLAAAAAGPLAGRAADGLIARGVPTLSVRRLMQCLSLLGGAAAVAPLWLVASPSLALAVGCLTASLALYSLSHSGFHAHLQDVAGSAAGVVYGLTNSASIAVGIGGNLATGLLLEATGSYGAVFVALMVLNASAALVFAVATSSEPLMPAAAGHEQ